MKRKSSIDATKVPKGGNKCLFDTYINPDLEISDCDKQGSSPSFYGLLKLKMEAKKIFNVIGDTAFVKAHPLGVHETYDGTRDISMKLEVMMMRYLSQLDRYHVTPCVPKYYADFICDSFEGSIGKKFQSSAKCLEGSVKEIKTINQPFVYLFTEKIDGITFTKWLEKSDEANVWPHYTYKMLEQIIFQILYTAYQFYLAGIRHNDLHCDNIMIQELNPPRDLHFVIKDKIYILFGCKWMPKIIDYNYASFYNTKKLKNDSQGHCDKYGICSYGPNQKIDPVRMLTDLSNTFLEKMRRIRMNDMQRAINNQYYYLLGKMSSQPVEMLIHLQSTYKAAFDGQLCHIDDYKKKKKCTNYEPSDELMLSFPLMLEKKIFTHVFCMDLTVTMIKGIKTSDLWISMDTPESIFDKMNCLRDLLAKNPYEGEYVGELDKDMLVDLYEFLPEKFFVISIISKHFRKTRINRLDAVRAFFNVKTTTKYGETATTLSIKDGGRHYSIFNLPVMMDYNNKSYIWVYGSGDDKIKWRKNGKNKNIYGGTFITYFEEKYLPFR